MHYGVYKLGDVPESCLDKKHRKATFPNAIYGICMPADSPVAWSSILFETLEEAEATAKELNKKRAILGY